MRMKKMFLVAAAALGAATALPAAAQFAKPEDAIKYRKAAFTVMGTHFGRLGAMANGRMPFDAKAASENAELVAVASHLPFAAFGSGTDLGETRARPEIWSEADKFRAAATKMQQEVAKLNAAAKTGSLDNLKAAFGGAARSCKACHDSYRTD